MFAVMNRFHASMGIRKTILLLLLSVFVPLLFLQAFTFYSWYRERKRTEMRANAEIARAVAKTFDAFVSDVVRTEASIGKAATVKPAPSRDALRQILLSAEHENQAFMEFIWIGPEGRVLVSSESAVEQMDLSRESLFVKAISGREWVLSDVFTSKRTGRQIFVIARPIRDAGGKLLGVVGAEILPEKLDDVRAVEREKDGGRSLIDSRGRHVYRYPARPYAREQLNWLKQFPIMAEALKGKEVAATVWSPRTEGKRLVAFAPVGSLGWVAAASRAEAAVIAEIREALLPLAMLILLVAVAAFAAVIVNAGPISHTIIRLRDHARALGRGEKREVGLATGPVELRELAAEFNEMAEKVRLREEALRTSEERMRLLENNLPESAVYQYAHEPDGSARFLSLSSGVEHMNGVSVADVLADAGVLHRQVPKDYRERFFQAEEQSKRDLSDFDMEVPMVRPDGETRWMRLHSRPHRIAGGRTVWDGVQTDVTDRKRAEDEVRRSRDELEQRVLERTADLENERRRLYETLEALPPMVYVLTPRHEILFANRAFREKLGEVRGRRCFEYLQGRDKPCDICPSFTVLETGVPVRWERVMPGGAVIDVYSAPFTDIDGSSLILEMDTDITEQRRAERERGVLEEHLRQSQKMEAVGTLAGGIAHDFNNMLAIILGNAELAMDDLDEAGDPVRNIRQIIRASKHARDLTKQILTFSRKTERGKSPLKLKPLLKETYQLLRGTIPSTIRMELDIRAEDDIVLADLSQIQQVLVNLAMNASYAMQKRGGVLTICLTSLALTDEGEPPGVALPPGRYVCLSVRDTGTGMAENVRLRVFEPFFTTKGQGKGTGMGLAVVYGIVKNHDGEIIVESAPGAGAKFNVFLPLAKAGAQIEPEEEGAVAGGMERILLVDDEPGVLRTTCEMLKSLGYKVTTCPDGVKAWRIFEKHPDRFHLVMTDQVMPGLTGMGLAGRILTVRSDLPVILFTGYSETVTPDQAKAAGIRACLMKPVTRREAAGTVRRVLDESRRGGGGGTDGGNGSEDGGGTRRRGAGERSAPGSGSSIMDPAPSSGFNPV